MTSLLSNLAKGVQKGKCIDFKSCLEWVNTKDNLFFFNCSGCNKNYKKTFLPVNWKTLAGFLTGTLSSFV